MSLQIKNDFYFFSFLEEILVVNLFKEVWSTTIYSQKDGELDNMTSFNDDVAFSCRVLLMANDIGHVC